MGLSQVSEPPDYEILAGMPGCVNKNTFTKEKAYINAGSDSKRQFQYPCATGVLVCLGKVLHIVHPVPAHFGIRNPHSFSRDRNS